MSLGFDPEVPAGYQDADIEMAELHAQANAMSTCNHNATTSAGECLDCGTILTLPDPQVTAAPTVWIPNLAHTLVEYLQEHTHQTHEWEVETNEMGRRTALTLRCLEDGATILVLRAS